GRAGRGGWMEEPDVRPTPGAEDRAKGRRCDHGRLPACGTRVGCDVARRRPAQQLRTEDEVGRAVVQDECAVGELVERRIVVELRARSGRDPFDVELRVDRVGSRATGMYVGPDLDE